MKSALLIGLLLFLGACAQARTTMVTPDTAVISGRGSAFHSPGEVVRLTLREAATQTVERGYRYFAILGAQDATQTGAVYTPGQTYSTTTGSAQAYSYGRTTTATGMATTRTYSTPGYVTPFTKPGMDATIRMYHQRPEGVEAWDAQQILAMKD